MLRRFAVRRFAIPALLTLLAAPLLAVLLAGCAGFPVFGGGLAPGRATEADARAQLGAPTSVTQGADGGKVLFYSRQPFGREIHAVRLGPDGTVRSVEQTLTYGHITSLRPGETTKAGALEALGPPYLVDRMPRQRHDTWEYWTLGLTNVPTRVWLAFSDDGILREIVQQAEEPLPRHGIFLGM